MPLPAQEAEHEMTSYPRRSNGHDEMSAEFEIHRVVIEDLRLRMASPKVWSLGVGSRLPDFLLPDAEGAPVASSELLSIGPLVVTFYRGMWCPFCNAELHALEAMADRIRRCGALLVAVSPQSVENNRRTAREVGATFPILSDPGAELARSFGIRWIPSQAVQGVYRNFDVDVGSFNVRNSWALPLPARYVAAQDGTILYARVSPNYIQRPEPADVLSVLDSLRRART
jgi:peroxiredoxin